MHLEAPHPRARRWLGRARGALVASSMWLSTIGPTSAADTIISARFTEPTTRYAHGVLGDNIEYGTLEITVQTQRSKQTQATDAAQDHSVLTIRLPEDRVFEDLSPRLMDVDSDGKFEVVVVETQAQEGAQLAIYDASGQKIAATPHIGTRFRWLAPIGAADLDRDGHIEVAYIDRPHLAKTLRIWRFENGQLTEIATLPGLTNHRIGEDFISGGIRECGSGPELIVASEDWRNIFSVRYANGWVKKQLGPFSPAAMDQHMACSQ